jgi:hypothetical protein
MFGNFKRLFCLPSCSGAISLRLQGKEFKIREVSGSEPACFDGEKRKEIGVAITNPR